MSRHRATHKPPRQERDTPQQLPLVAPVAKVRPRNVDLEVAAKIAIQRRAKPSPVPGRVKLMLVLELRRALAERLSARGIREGKNLEAIIIEILEASGTVMCADLKGFVETHRPCGEFAADVGEQADDGYRCTSSAPAIPSRRTGSPRRSQRGI